MQVEQKSLSEFTISNSWPVNVTVSLYKYLNNVFVKGEYATCSTLSYNSNGDYVLGVGSINNTLFFNTDGIYKFVATGDGQTLEFVVHNIMELLKVRQEFLTKALMEYNISNCNSNNYVDYCTFVILFNNYIDMVEAKFHSNNRNITTDTLYKLDYLYSQLLKYKP
jgi:hypothetical protein